MDQMLPRGYLTDLDHSPDAEFQHIVSGFQHLRPTCNELTTPSAANNLPGMQEVDEGVVQLVKDSGKKLTNTINLKHKLLSEMLGVPPAMLIVPKILLPAYPTSGSHWGLSTTVQNAGACAPNAPPANTPGSAQIQPPALAAVSYQIPPPPPNPQGSIQLPLPASGIPGPSGGAG